MIVPSANLQTLNKKKIELFKRKRSPWRDLHVLFLSRRDGEIA